MDYEVKYKQALERARQFSEHPLQEDSANIVEYIFLELEEEKNENEDEKIRKALIENFKFFGGDYLETSKWGKDDDLLVTDILAWLEKQNVTWCEEDESWFKELKLMALSFSNDVSYRTEFFDWLKSVKDRVQHKVEPKFHPGDWVILNGIVAQILDKQKYGFVGLDIDGKDFFCNYGHTDSMRLWSINDAKDGDVLWHSDSASNGIFVFKEIRHDGKVLCYCDYDSEDHFCTGEHHTCCWSNDKYIKPATKEQRDLLFQKMKEAGYEWDAKKKEVKKIEPKKLNADKVIAWLVTNIVDFEYCVKLFKKDFKL